MQRSKLGWAQEHNHLVKAICAMFCLAVAGPALRAENTFDGAYTGKRVRVQASDSKCTTSDPVEDNVSITIKGEELTFSNSKLTNYAMGFNPHPDGSFSDVHVEVGGSFVEIQGHIAGEVFDADVTDGSCGYHWHLTKEHRG